MSQFVVHFADAAFVMAAFDDVAITVSRGQITAAHMRMAHRVSAEHYDAWGRTTRGISLVEPTTLVVGNMSEEVRASTEAMLSEFPPLASVTVIEGSGFAVAAIRMLMSGIYLLKRHRGALRIVSTVDEGVRAVAALSVGQPVTQFTERQLADALERARAAGTKAPPR